MPTAQLNIRVPAEHHDLVRMIAARLRQDKDFAGVLAALVAETVAVADSSNSRSNVDPILEELAITQAEMRAVHMTLHDVVTLRDRLEILEAEVAGLRQRGADEPVEPVEGVEARIEALEAEALLDEIAPEPRQRGASTALDAVEPVEAADMPVSTEALPKAVKKCQTRKRWTEADDAVLRRIAAEGGTQADAVAELDRSESVISQKWRALGLPVSPRKGRKLARRKRQEPHEA
jgi:hypothetical protein